MGRDSEASLDDAASLAADLALVALQRMADGGDPVEVAASVLPRIVSRTEMEAAAVFEPQGGRWKLIGCSGSVDPPSEAAVADRAAGTLPTQAAGWYYAAVGQTPTGPRLLALHPAHDSKTDAAGLATAIGEVIHAALQFARDSDALRDITRRLEQLLHDSAGWQRAEDTSTLFHSLAETAARLLDAERASIFLLDARRGVLVGHPALGVDREHLEVASDAGIVGGVMKSGVPSRWSESDGRDEVNRGVDQRTGFVTRSLCAVPIPDSRGRTVGVFEVINKGAASQFTPQDQRVLQALAAHAAGAIRGAQHREELIKQRSVMVDVAATDLDIIGRHPKIESMKETVQRVANTDLAVLILGENGTGKEIVARNVHFGSPRRERPFIAVNCAALVETLLESELFGHVKGAFTDAASDRVGKFEQAHGGTLFLDEIGDMSLAGQAKLLRVLEEKKIVRVGGGQTIDTDVRVIAATNQSLADRVKEGKFREDLYFRLSVVVLQLPPLRERGRDDIVALAQFFLDKYCADAGRPIPQLTEAAEAALLRHPWPGNVRELRNVMERLAYLGSGDRVEEHDLVFSASPRRDDAGVAAGQSLTDATRQFQQAYIRQTIEQHGGKVSAAAKSLGLHRSNMYRKMRSLGMEANEE